MARVGLGSLISYHVMHPRGTLHDAMIYLNSSPSPVAFAQEPKTQFVHFSGSSAWVLCTTDG